MYYNNQVEQGAETLVFRRLKARLLLKRFQLSQNTSRKHFSFPETSIFYCNKKKTEKNLTWICQTSLTELYLVVTVGSWCKQTVPTQITHKSGPDHRQTLQKIHLEHKRCCLTIRKQFCAVQVTEHWLRLLWSLLLGDGWTLPWHWPKASCWGWPYCSRSQTRWTQNPHHQSHCNSVKTNCCTL